MASLWSVSFPLWQLVLRGAVVYACVLLLLRLGGKRQIGQMGAGEFVAILLISNAVQNAMNGGDNSITGGLVLAAVIISLSFLTSYLTFRSQRWENLIEGRPRLLIHNGQLIPANLDKELLSIHELRAILRRQGFHDVAEISEAILESNGSVSIIKRGESLSHRALT